MDNLLKQLLLDESSSIDGLITQRESNNEFGEDSEYDEEFESLLASNITQMSKAMKAIQSGSTKELSSSPLNTAKNIIPEEECLYAEDFDGSNNNTPKVSNKLKIISDISPLRISEQKFDDEDALYADDFCVSENIPSRSTRPKTPIDDIKEVAALISLSHITDAQYLDVDSEVPHDIQSSPSQSANHRQGGETAFKLSEDDWLESNDAVGDFLLANIHVEGGTVSSTKESADQLQLRNWDDNTPGIKTEDLSARQSISDHVRKIAAGSFNDDAKSQTCAGNSQRRTLIEPRAAASGKQATKLKNKSSSRPISAPVRQKTFSKALRQEVEAQRKDIFLTETPTQESHQSQRPKSANNGMPISNLVASNRFGGKFWPFMPSSKDTNGAHASNSSIKISQQIQTLNSFLSYLQEKSDTARSIVESANEMWQRRLLSAHSAAVSKLNSVHHLELKKFIDQNVSEKGENDLVHSLRIHGAVVGGKHAVYISDMHTESNLSRINFMKNKLLERQYRESYQLDISVKIPIKKLDNLRGKLLYSIDWLNTRAARSVEHFVRSEIAAAQNKRCEILQIRSDLSKDAAYSMIRQSLESLANICRQVPRYYANVDSDKALAASSQKTFTSSIQKYINQINLISDEQKYVFADIGDFEVAKSPKRVYTRKEENDTNVAEGNQEHIGQSTDDFEYCQIVKEINEFDEHYLDEFVNEAEAELREQHIDDEVAATDKVRPIDQSAEPDIAVPKHNFELTGIFKDLGVDTSAYLRGIRFEERKTSMPKKLSECSQCSKQFYGQGKRVPSNRDEAIETSLSHKKELLKQIKKKLKDPHGRLSEAERSGYMNKASSIRKVLAAEKNTFCSWKCVKSWVSKNYPIQKRYNTELLIDMIAGEIL